MKIVLLVCNIFFLSCSLLPEKQIVMNLSVDKVAKLSSKNEEKIVYPGKSIPITKADLPVLVEAPEHVPTLIIDPGDSVEQTVKIKKLEHGFLQKDHGKRLNDELNASISEVFRIISLIDDNKYRNALKEIEKCKKQKPKVAYFYFLEASVLHQLGQKKNARKALKRGMSIYDGDPRAKQYYRELAGE